jgi:UDP-N-acetylglucosamine diphosphorylase / glucose-1-phosphate thymidylyltransferase / UDP-N-acetylgalactosamine diphosphorylase / glucosamine-1-phosphate N-acetyltransferase / galactosamine-1-phosphate N-acetyltransferase
VRICLDVDGTLCEIKSHGDEYAHVRPLPHAAEAIRALRAAGHYVILATARHMKTCNSNVGLVVARQGPTLIEWLTRHGIEYDELWFGKPHADLYVDDKAMAFSGNWYSMTPDRLVRQAGMESQKMNLIVAMAGAGSRFSRAGYDLPKPLIPAFGEPMYRHAVRSLPLHLAERLICIIRRDPHAAALRRDIEDTFGAYRPIVVEIDELTRGQAETVLYAKHDLAFHLPVLVHNADSAFEVRSFAEFPPAADGALLLFHGTGTKWSYAAMEADGRVTRVTEKDPISPYASTGTYYFRSSVQLFHLIEEAIRREDTTNGEYYLGPLYNQMIAQGYIARGSEVERFISFGTPEDLALAEADPANRDAIKRLADRVATKPDDLLAVREDRRTDPCADGAS